MSLLKNDSNESIENKKNIAIQIAKILRADYESSGSAIKWIARHTGASEHAVRNWYDAARQPYIENFIALTKASPRLIEWFLEAVGREDLSELIQQQNRAAKQCTSNEGWDVMSLIFETHNICEPILKMQKMSLRQLWFFVQIKNGRKLHAKDLVFMFGISRSTAYRDIQGLVDLNLICSVRQGRCEYYTVL